MKESDKKKNTEVPQNQQTQAPPMKTSYLYLMEDINNDTIKPIISSIIGINENINTPHMDHVKTINLVINTGGGHIHSAFSLVDVIASSVVPITTIGTGLVASAGTIIFICGHKRILTPNTSFLIHQASHSLYGKSHDMHSYYNNEISTIKSRMHDHYKKFSNLDSKGIQEQLLGPTDTWLTPTQVKKLGMCDTITTKLKF